MKPGERVDPIKTLGFDPGKILTMPTVVCDGWVRPQHPRIVLKQGNSELVSHGMCPECEKEMSK